MKITAGTYIGPENSARLLNRKYHTPTFKNLNELRLHMQSLDFIPEGDLDDFGRGSIAVRYSLLAAMFTAGDYGKTLPENTGISGWNGRGCTAENLRYWQDFTANGHESGRGGLFVATLPSIPYCEAAIALNCHGPASYLQTERSTQALFRLLKARPAGLYLIGEIEEQSACMLLADTTLPDETLPDFTTLEELFSHLEKQA